MGRLFPDNGRESSEKQPTGISCRSRCTGCLIIRKNRLNLFRGFNGKRQQQCGKASQLLKTVCYPNWNSVVNNGVSLCAKDRECAVGAVFELMLAGTAANFFPNRAEPCFHHRKVSIGEDTSRQAVAAGQSLSNGQFHREQSIGYAVLLNNIHAVAVGQIQSRSAVQFQAKLLSQYEMCDGVAENSVPTDSLTGLQPFPEGCFIRSKSWKRQNGVWNWL